MVVVEQQVVKDKNHQPVDQVVEVDLVILQHLVKNLLVAVVLDVKVVMLVVMVDLVLLFFV